jgi:S-DNA-T family DNA segregation ATPase FtsK/SpoIIIE
MNMLTFSKDRQPRIEMAQLNRIVEDAIALVRKHNRASAALLQRRLRVSFNRAARLIDLLEHP